LNKNDHWREWRNEEANDWRSSGGWNLCNARGRAGHKEKRAAEAGGGAVTGFAGELE
jgi:hypothetical protein